MDEKISLSKQKIIEQKKFNNDKSIKKSIINNYFFKCWLNCFSNFKNKLKNCLSNCSIFKQFLICILPISQLIILGLVLIMIYFFDVIFKYDYYTFIRKEFLKYLITDIDDTHFEISSNEINIQFEDIGNIIFFKLYFGELISLGLLEEEKIFPNISNFTETLYKKNDEQIILDGAYTVFSIPANLSRKYIDERNDSLAELSKIYFNFYPIISGESKKLHTYINQTFLIAYEMKDNSTDIKGEEMYFNFPRIYDDFQENNNFFPYNNLISPKINLKLESLEIEPPLNTQTFYSENWFIKHDSFFRIFASEKNDIDINFLHINVEHEGNINKSTINYINSFYKNKNGKRFIIDIIFFIGQKNYKASSFDHSIFLVTNHTGSAPNIRFSDDKSFVISQNYITEISLSELITDYFHYGFISRTNHFFSKGINYDNIDLNNFYDPINFYSTVKNLQKDIGYFTPFYLYSKLFQKSLYNKNYSEEESSYIFIFNDTKHIKDICGKFNFSNLQQFMRNTNLDCFTKENLLFYPKEKTHYSIAEEISFPFCICLPLYCIKNLQRNFNTDEIEFVDEIILPEKCQNKFSLYENNIKEENLEKSDEVDSSKSEIRIGENLDELLEDQFTKFIYKKLNSIEDLINNLNKLKQIFSILIVIGIFFAFNIMTILIGINIYKISRCIYEYKEKLKHFLSLIQNKKENLSNKKLI